MNWDSLQQQWRQLTDDQLDVISGQGDLLLDRVQEAYGIIRDRTSADPAPKQP